MAHLIYLSTLLKKIITNNFLWSDFTDRPLWHRSHDLMREVDLCERGRFCERGRYVWFHRLASLAKLPLSKSINNNQSIDRLPLPLRHVICAREADLLQERPICEIDRQIGLSCTDRPLSQVGLSHDPCDLIYWLIIGYWWSRGSMRVAEGKRGRFCERGCEITENLVPDWLRQICERGRCVREVDFRIQMC